MEKIVEIGKIKEKFEESKLRRTIEEKINQWR